MLKRLRTAHPILYCILAEVLFLGSLFLSSLVPVSYTHLDVYKRQVPALSPPQTLRQTGPSGAQGLP